MRTYITVRKITKEECPWLPGDIPPGVVLFEYPDRWSVVSGSGVCVTKKPDQLPYFEVPRAAIINNPGSTS